MTPEQKAAFVMSQAACAMAKIAGMQAENQIRNANNLSLAYTEKDFFDVIDRNGIGHNDIVMLFRT